MLISAIGYGARGCWHILRGTPLPVPEAAEAAQRSRLADGDGRIVEHSHLQTARLGPVDFDVSRPREVTGSLPVAVIAGGRHSGAYLESGSVPSFRRVSCPSR